MLVKRNKELFLFDSNTFISAANQFYADDIAPTFWKEMKQTAENSKQLFLLDKVKNEIFAGADFINNWLLIHGHRKMLQIRGL